MSAGDRIEEIDKILSEPMKSESPSFDYYRSPESEFTNDGKEGEEVIEEQRKPFLRQEKSNTSDLLGKISQSETRPVIPPRPLEEVSKNPLIRKVDDLSK